MCGVHLKNPQGEGEYLKVNFEDEVGEFCHGRGTTGTQASGTVAPAARLGIEGAFATCRLCDVG